MHPLLAPDRSGHELRVAFSVSGSVTRALIVRALTPRHTPLQPARPGTPPRIAIYQGIIPVFRTDSNSNSGALDCLSAFLVGSDFFTPLVSDFEAAVLITLPPGHYTAVVTGMSREERAALIELENLAVMPAPPTTSPSAAKPAPAAHPSPALRMECAFASA